MLAIFCIFPSGCECLFNAVTERLIPDLWRYCGLIVSLYRPFKIFRISSELKFPARTMDSRRRANSFKRGILIVSCSSLGAVTASSVDKSDGVVSALSWASVAAAINGGGSLSLSGRGLAKHPEQHWFSSDPFVAKQVKWTLWWHFWHSVSRFSSVWAKPQYEHNGADAIG